jgi:hypothetical protein
VYSIRFSMEVVGFVSSCLLWKGCSFLKQNDNISVKQQQDGKKKSTSASSSGSGLGSLSAYESLVGNTPLVRLRKASELTGCDILVKMECMNPGRVRE